MRRAISPVLATVRVIAITLISAVAIAGFVFGLFGIFTSTSQPNASQVMQSGTITLPSHSLIISCDNKGGNYNWTPVDGSYPNGTKWISYAYCTFNGYAITSHGQYPNGTQWWTVKQA